jgi:hypothetical protein
MSLLKIAREPSKDSARPTLGRPNLGVHKGRNPGGNYMQQMTMESCLEVQVYAEFVGFELMNRSSVNRQLCTASTNHT